MTIRSILVSGFRRKVPLSLFNPLPQPMAARQRIQSVPVCPPNKRKQTGGESEPQHTFGYLPHPGTRINRDGSGAAAKTSSPLLPLPLSG